MPHSLIMFPGRHTLAKAYKYIKNKQIRDDAIKKYGTIEKIKKLAQESADYKEAFRCTDTNFLCVPDAPVF